MTIKQTGGIFGRNPSFNDVDVNTLDVSGDLNVTGDVDFSGDLSVDSGTLTVDSVNNYVGIGTAFPGDKLTVNGNVYLGTTSRSVYTGGSADLRIQTNTGNTKILRNFGATEVASFTSVGLAFPSGNGIDFSATSGTGTSELFDDYEEGVWSPVYIPQIGSFATMTMSVSEAKYTKIGRFVYIQASILTNNVDTTGASGGLRLSGLPFSSSGFGSFIVSYSQNWGGDFPLYGYIENGSTYANLRYRTSVNGADSSMLVGDLATGAVASQNYMIVSGVYTVA